MVTTTGTAKPARAPGRLRLQRVYWTLGNLLLFGGLYLLLYVGGIYAEVSYHRMAARGDSDIEAPRLVMGELDLAARQRPAATAAAPTSGPAATAAAPTAAAQAQAAAAHDQPAATEAPAQPVAAAVAAEGQLASPPPAPEVAAHISTVERVILPSVKLDAKVIEVGWEVVEQDGQEVAVWQVAEYAVGQHRGSANPGEGENIVLAGHVGGFGQVFRDLYYVLPGDPVILYSEGQKYEYVVNDRRIVDEEGAPAEQRAANAALIGPAGAEMVTLVTCWPPTGPEKFTQRVIIRAVPAGG